MVNGEIRFIANDGTPHTGLEPLDLAGLIANNLSESDLVGGSLAAGAFVGHIHMRAKAPEELMTFYLDVLGFRSNIQSRAFGMFDVGTTVRRHMVAFNIWAGAALTEPPDNAAGLAHFTVNVPSPEVMAAVVSRLRVAGLRPTDTGSSVLCPDPEGNQVRIAIA